MIPSIVETAGFADGGGDGIAIFFVETGKETRTISRREFVAHARRHAAAALRAGVRPGDLVVIAHDSPLALAYGFWGLILAGAVPSIYTTPNERLFPEVYRANVSAMLEDNGARALLTSDELAEVFTGRIPTRVLGLERMLAEAADAPAPPAPEVSVPPDRLAYLQTSSGTTGNQRGVPTTHGMIRNQIEALAARMDVRPDDVIVSWMPLYHDGGLILGAILPFHSRVPVVLISPLDWVRHPAILFKAIHDHRGTFVNMPNFAFNHCVRRIRDRDLEGIRLDGMRAFVNGSERVYHTSFERFLERFAPLGVTRDRLGTAYGLAENTLMVSHTVTGTPLVYDTVDREALELRNEAVPVATGTADAVVNVSCGPPLDGVEVRIRDDGDRDLPERKVGQIVIRSGSLFSGYYRRPERNAQLFRGEWFLTGDMGYLADGQVYVVGRLKDLIIHGGKNIYPADVEEIVGTVPGVKPGRVVAFGVPDEAEGTELIAVVAEVAPEAPEEQAEIAKRIRVEVNRRTSLTVSFVDVLSGRWIIKTSSGKTSRSANRRKWLEAKRADPAAPLRGSETA
jgi:acyl-CoA synthetase (AMP-forming)/AMP-acid ligase II